MLVPAGFRDSLESPLADGEVIASTYEIGAELARTDTGAVFEAHDMLLDREVAVKIAWRDAGLPSLLAEARRCAAVRDPCAVQVYEMGQHGPVEFVVGERVDGVLLGVELAASVTAATPLPEERYLAHLRGVAAAVARAHDAGIAVGDISGATVLVGERGRLVLGRLSLSQVPAFGPHGQIIAPEVLRGDSAADDPAAAEMIDLYGLGCVAIELAAGAPPFEGRLLGHRDAPPPRLANLRPDLPVELSDLVEWLLAKDPARRPASAADVLAQLDAIAERIGSRLHPLRVLVVDDDTARARWLWSLARRAHAGAIVEIASEGTDAAHKLNRDQPELVLVDAALRGVMNALELCMYARGLEGGHGELCLVGDTAPADRALLGGADVSFIPDDAELATNILSRVRRAAGGRPRARKPRTTISG